MKSAGLLPALQSLAYYQQATSLGVLQEITHVHQQLTSCFVNTLHVSHAKTVGHEQAKKISVQKHFQTSLDC